jgi:multidrug resistance efflux pump
MMNPRICLALFLGLFLAGTAPARAQEPVKVVGKAYCLIKDSITVQEVAGNDPHLTITSVLAKVGDHVEADARLAGYKPMLERVIAEKAGLSRHKLSGLEAQLEAATLALERERIRREEMRQMHEKGVVAESDLRMIDRSIDIFEKKLTFLREIIAAEKSRMTTRENTARENMGVNVETGAFPDEFFITAPFSGYVLYVNPQAMPGVIFARDTKEPLFEVGVLDKIVVRCAVHEIQAVKLKVGDKARMVFFAHPDRVYESTIAKISQVTMTQFLQQPTFYEVEIALDNADLAIKDGMRCDITLQPGP